MKRLLAILLAVSLLAGMMVFQVSAETQSGICGDNLTWKVEGSTLTISGTGPMYDYSEENPAPWPKTAYEIYIEDGVTSIGDYAFAGCDRFTTASIPASVTEVGDRAFYNSATRAAGFLCFLGDAPTFGEDVFLQSDGIDVKYFRDWDTAVMQDYGGSPTWEKGYLSIAQGSKMLFALNEEIKAYDFNVYARYNKHYPGLSYKPEDFVIGSYDNTTYGQKSVDIHVDGYDFRYIYYVTDGQNHLDLINVELPLTIPYSWNAHNKMPKPVVTVGELTLTDSYSLAYANTTELGYDAQLTISGGGIYEGFEKKYTYAILKRDIADTYIYVNQPEAFIGWPVMPEVTVMESGLELEEGTDYVLVYENNVNVGTGTVRIIGIGNYCGFVTKEFQIGLEATAVSLSGAYNGTATENVNDNVSYSEGILTPGVFTGRINSSNRHIAYYELYRIDGETPVLITTQQSEYNTSAYTTFSYDFTSVYESAAETGGEVYMLAYSWIDYYNKVYSGVYALYIPAKVSDATAMEIEMVEDTSDYDKAYLDLFGIDGNVENAEWTTSNAAVATVEDGVVSLKSPGTVTITAHYAGATASFVGEVIARSISECAFFGYDVEEEIAYVACDYILMTEGIDYVKSVSVQEDVTVVTISGIGLFTGELVGLFNTQTGEAIGETHNFDNSCDGQCNHCEYIRSNDHQAESGWIRNKTHHWHLCGVCAEKVEITEHTVNEQDSNLCDVCGTICLTGDVDGDGEVTDWDGVMLARYLAGWPVEVELAALDVDGDGEVTDWDGVVLDRYLAGWNVTIG